MALHSGAASVNYETEPTLDSEIFAALAIKATVPIKTPGQGLTLELFSALLVAVCPRTPEGMPLQISKMLELSCR